MRDMTVDSPYFKEYLDMIINNPKFADKYLTHTLLKSLGFKRTPCFYKDNPEKILNKAMMLFLEYMNNMDLNLVIMFILLKYNISLLSGAISQIKGRFFSSFFFL